MADSIGVPAEALPGIAVHSPDGGALSGRLGIRDLVLSAIAFAAPLAGTVGYVGVTIAYGNGLGTPAIFIVTTIALGLFSFGFGALAQAIPRPGSFYAYITAGLGKRVGLGASFVTLFSYVVMGVGFYAFAGLTLQGAILRWDGPKVPWYLCALVFWVAVAFLGYLRIDISARVLAFVLVAEIIAVGIFDAVVMGKGGPEGVSASVFSPSNFGNGHLGLALILAVTMYVGFESTAIYREETVNPGRTIARATVICAVAIGLFYAVTSWAFITGLGTSHAVDALNKDLAGSFFTVAQRDVGPWFQDMTTVLLVTSVFASHLGIQNSTSRYVYSLSKDGVLPESLSAVHKSHHSPYRASLLTSGAWIVLTGGVMAFGVKPEEMYAWFAGIGAIAIVIGMGMTSLAAVVYFARNKGHEISLWKTRVAPAIATVYFAVCLVLAMQNLPALIGGSRALGNGMIAVIFAIFLLGLGLAWRFKTTKPDVFARIGREEI